MGSPSGAHSSGSSSQSPGHFAPATASGGAGISASTARSAARFRAWDMQSTQMSFSLARVRATYRMRISSALLSRVRAAATADLVTVSYRIRRCRSTRSVPSPSWGCTSTGRWKSSELKRLCRSARITTGNSSPLDRWTLMICTPLPVAWVEIGG